MYTNVTHLLKHGVVWHTTTTLMRDFYVTADLAAFLRSPIERSDHATRTCTTSACRYMEVNDSVAVAVAGCLALAEVC